jgi:hypothetical protein
MSIYLSQIRSAVEATTFSSGNSYSCFGKRSAGLPVRARRAITPQATRHYLLTQLQTSLYSDFYVSGGTELAPNETNQDDDTAGFEESLSEANCGSGHWENGWIVASAVSDSFTVRKNGLTLRTTSAEIAMCSGPENKPGSEVSVRFPKELLGVSPGYYFVLSNQGAESQVPGDIVRLYWNLRSDGAVKFVRIASRKLNEANLFFKLKVLNRPVSYVRCDAAVLYLHKRDYQRASGVIAWLQTEIAGHLKPGTPVFTKRLRAGVGLAEDPGNDESFGLHRCRVLAEGLLQAYEQGARSLEQRFRVISECFETNGIRPSHPYLNPNSADVYSIFGEERKYL